ncbi:hypothetical protein D3C76_1264340 [compost metagenome]
MDQQCLHGIADGRPLHLGIDSNIECDSRVGGFIQIGVADACASFDNRNSRIGHYGLNQHAASPGDNHIQQAVKLQHLIHGATVAGGNQLQCLGRHHS